MSTEYTIPDIFRTPNDVSLAYYLFLSLREQFQISSAAQIRELEAPFSTVLVVFPTMTTLDLGGASAIVKEGFFTDWMQIANEYRTVGLLNYATEFESYARLQGDFPSGFDAGLPVPGTSATHSHRISVALARYCRHNYDFFSRIACTQSFDKDALARECACTPSPTASEEVWVEWLHAVGCFTKSLSELSSDFELEPTCEDSEIASVSFPDCNTAVDSYVLALKSSPIRQKIIAACFENTQLSCDGLAALQSFENLQLLELVGLRLESPFSAGIRLCHLRELYLVDCGVVNADLEIIKAMRELRVLILDDNEVSSLDIEHLGDSKIEYLSLERTHFSDEGLFSLSSLHCLKHLSLSGTEVTGIGLEALVNLKKLELLNLDNLQVNIDALRRFLPKMLRLKTLVLPASLANSPDISALDRRLSFAKIVYAKC